MPKLRMTVTFSAEYDASPEDYDGETDPAKMAEIDRVNLEDDPSLYMTAYDGETVVRVEVVE